MSLPYLTSTGSKCQRFAQVVRQSDSSVAISDCSIFREVQQGASRHGVMHKSAHPHCIMACRHWHAAVRARFGATKLVCALQNLCHCLAKHDLGAVVDACDSAVPFLVGCLQDCIDAGALAWRCTAFHHTLYDRGRAASAPDSRMLCTSYLQCLPGHRPWDFRALGF